MASVPPTCPISGETMRPWMDVPGDWRRPRERSRWSIYWCDSCAFGTLSPRPDEAELAAAYAVEYYTRQRASEAPRPGVAQRLRLHIAWRADTTADVDPRWIRPRIDRPIVSICDVGCGGGTLLALFRRAGHDVVGVEPDPGARAAARELGLEVYPGTAEHLPDELPRGRYDVVLMSHVIEHCVDPLRAAASVAELLRPGGLVMCEAPNNAALGLTLTGVAWPWLDVPRHLNFFTRRSLEAVWLRTGLSVEELGHHGYGRQFAPWWLDTERSVRDGLVAALGERGGALRRLTRSVELRAWVLLFRTIGASPDRKYDSVRVVARKRA